MPQLEQAEIWKKNILVLEMSKCIVYGEFHILLLTTSKHMTAAF